MPGYISSISLIHASPVIATNENVSCPEKALLVLLARLELTKVKDLRVFISCKECTHENLRIVKHVEATVTLFVLVIDREMCHEWEQLALKGLVLRAHLCNDV